MSTGLRHELYLSGAWVDISDDIRAATSTQISRGASGGKSLSATGRCTFVLDDRGGDYEPRNPAGPYYGQIGLNVPHRVSVDSSESYLWVPAAGYMSTPDDAAYAVTDLDVRIEVTMHDWCAFAQLCGQLPSGAADTSWGLYVYNGRPVLYRSTDGTTLVSSSPVGAVVPVESGRVAIRVTLDANNGASGHTITFYFSDSIDGAWTQLGDPVVTAGVFTLHDSSADLAVGDAANPARFHGRVHAFQLLDSIDGSAVVDLDLSAEVGGDTSITDATGNDWTVQAGAEIRDREYLWWGELGDLPHSQDQTGKDVTVGATSSDVASRMLTSAGYEQSAYRQSASSESPPFADLVEYWPMEDESDASSFASGLDGGAAMTWRGDVTPAQNEDFYCSRPLPTLTDTSILHGSVRAAADGAVTARLLLSIPSGGVGAVTRIFRLDTTGTAAIWELRIDTSGQLQLYVRGSDYVLLDSTAWVAFGLVDSHTRIGLALEQSGADIDYAVSSISPETMSAGQFSGTFSGMTLGHAKDITIAADRGLDGVSCGQVTIQSANVSVYEADDALVSWSGPYADHETGGTRLVRVMGNEGITYYTSGSAYLSTRMGRQQVANVGTIARDVVGADLGILLSSAEDRAIEYRTRTSMTAQAAALTLSYSGGDLSDWSPINDRELLVNRLELTRTDGATYVAEVTAGRLSVADPEDGGTGRTPDSARINIEYDDDLPDQSGWRLSLGTADAPRTVDLSIELARSVFTGADILAALLVRVGDRIDVTDLPVLRNPDDLQFLVVGVSHEITRFRHIITFRCWPYEPHRVAVCDYPIGDEYSRYSGDGTILAEDLDTTETGVDITAPAGVTWTHDDGDYDVVTGGEVMTVTGIAGAAPDYTFTVTRSVNGVVKTHTSGVAIDLHRPVYIGL